MIRLSETLLQKIWWLPVVLQLVMSGCFAIPIILTGLYLEPDSDSYLNAGAGFWGTGFYSRDGVVPELFRTPGYSLFAGAFTSTGEVGVGVGLLLLLQILLRTGVIWLILNFKFGERELLPPSARWVAAMLFALDLPSAMSSLLLLSECLSACTLFLGFWLFMRWIYGDRGTKWLLAAGFVLGIATLIRPGNLLIPVILLAFGMLHRWLNSSQEKREIPWRQLLIFFLIANILPTLWVARNVAYTGQPILSLKSSELLYFYRAVSIKAAVEGREFDDVITEYRAKEMLIQQQNPAPIWVHAERWSREGREAIAAHPVVALKISVMGFARNVLGPGRSMLIELENKLQWKSRMLSTLGTYVTLATLALVYGGILLALVRCRRDREKLALVFLCGVIAIAILVPSSGVESYSRFRIPAMPLLCLAAGLGFCRRE